MKKIWIICAATHFEDDTWHKDQPINILTGIVVTGRRHSTVYSTLSELGINFRELGPSKQGFLTSDNRFVDRTEAAEIAYKAGQINKPSDILTSEDLY